MATRKTVKVRFIDSVAGLGTTEGIGEEGKKISIGNPYGLRAQYSFRPGEIAVIDAELAEKWTEGQICELVPAETPIARPALGT